MRRTRLIITAVGATAALAMSPAVASAAGPITDDAMSDFAAGAPGAGAWVVEPGSVQLKPTGVSANFDGALPAGWTAPTPPPVADGALSADGALVSGAPVAPTAAAPQTLEFRGAFGTAPFQHAGFGDTFDTGPWAIFSTGGGTLATGLYARTLTGTSATDTPIAIPDPTAAHVYRIEWTTTGVTFSVDGTTVAQHTVAIPDQMKPAIRDLTAGDGQSIRIDWLGLLPEPASGAFESRVFDATSVHALWRTLTPTDSKPVGTGIEYAARTGDTPVPDATWSAYQPVGAGGAIQSPAGRYLQYRATMSSADGAHTPTLDMVEASYDVDETAPLTSIDDVAVAGTTAAVSFSSGATDVARFECSLDGGAFSACTSPKRLTGLAPGSHTVAVRAVDKAANAGPASSESFTIQAPTTGGGGTPQPAGGGNGGATVDRTAPVITVAKRTMRVTRRGSFAMVLRCPRGEVWCKVDVKVRRGGAVVASRRIRLAGGQRATIRLALAKSARAALARRHQLRVTATVAARDAAGNRATRRAKLRLLAPRR